MQRVGLHATCLHELLSSFLCCSLQRWEDLELIYAGQRMADNRQLRDYHVPPVGGVSWAAAAAVPAAVATTRWAVSRCVATRQQALLSSGAGLQVSDRYRARQAGAGQARP